MKNRILFKTCVLVVVCISLCTSCSIFNKKKMSSNKDVLFGSVIGSFIGVAIGYKIGGKSGAAIGAVVGAAAGAAMVVVIDEINKKQIQDALKQDHVTTFKDKKSGQKIKIAPSKKYVNSDNLSCIGFGIHNLDLKTYKLGNSACKIKGVYEFIVAENNILIEPVINHVAPFPIPDPTPKPQVNL